MVKRVAHQHHRYRKQSEKCEPVHMRCLPPRLREGRPTSGFVDDRLKSLSHFWRSMPRAVSIYSEALAPNEII